MRVRCVAFGLLLLAGVVLPGRASGQTAADKATARDLAMTGIRLHQEGQHAEALDHLRRAQELFNAPVHLLFIARVQEKLGHLVEAAENYRTLSRQPLQAGAPDAWTRAVEDGKSELAALEPRIPKLRVVVVPAAVVEPKLSIDGVVVSAAVIGIDRAVNPGSRRVELSARGKAPVQATVNVPEGKTTEIRLELRDGPPAAPPSAAAAGRRPPKAEEKSFIGYLLGLRFGGALAAGALGYSSTLDRELKTSDFFQGGGGLELHAGVRLGQLFTPVLLASGVSFSPGDGPAGTEGVKKPASTVAGVGLLFGTPPGTMGGFGELDLVATTNGVEYTRVGVGSAPDQACTLTARGTGIRIGGGGVFPVARWLQLTPFAMALFARTHTLDTSDDCGFSGGRKELRESELRTSTLIFLGVGGDIVLGGDRPD